MITLSRRVTMILLLLIVLLGWRLRIFHLGTAAIWGDEAYSISLALKPFSQVVAVGADTHPPLFHVLLHFWMLIAGKTEFAARFPALLAGTVLIAATWAVGRRLASRPAALSAAALMAISPFAVAYSQEARMYSQAALLGALSIACAAHLWRSSAYLISPSRAHRWPAAAYLLITLAAMFTHLYAFLLIAAQDVFVLILWRRKPGWLWRWIAGQAILAAAFLPWVIPQIGFYAGKNQSRSAALGLDTLWQVVAQTATAFSVGWPAPPELGVAPIVTVPVVLIGLIVITYRDPRNALRWFTALYLFVPLILAWLTGPLLYFFHPRYLLIVLPAFLLCSAAGLVRLSLIRPRLPFGLKGLYWWGPVSAFLLIIVTAGSALSLLHLYVDPAYAKSGYREMMSLIRAQSRPGDVLFLLNPEQSALYDYYGDPSLPSLVFPDQMSEARLAKVEKEDTRIWLVMFGNARDWDPGGDLQGWLSTHAFRARRDALIDTEVELYVIGQVEPSPMPPVDFGGLIALEGYGVSAETLAPGDTLQIALVWLAEGKIDQDYTIFTHLIDDQGQVVGQFDGQPLNGAHPTSTWGTGEKNVDRFGIQIDPATPPGAYWLEVGWYAWPSLERIPVLDAGGQRIDDRALLIKIEVK